MMAQSVNGHSSTFARIRVTLPNGTAMYAGDSIPEQFLEYPDTWTPPVAVTTHGIEAIVGRDCAAEGACTFDFRDELTTALHAVTPALVGGGVVRAELPLAGAGAVSKRAAKLARAAASGRRTVVRGGDIVRPDGSSVAISKVAGDDREV